MSMTKTKHEEVNAMANYFRSLDATGRERAIATLETLREVQARTKGASMRKE